jgi:hypothetical protein
MHENSKMMFDKHFLNLFKNDHRVLEVGADSSMTFRHKVHERCPQVIWDATDIQDFGWATFKSEEHKICAPSNTYDIVFSTQVIEHVRKPWVWMKDLARVCKRGGLVLTICPVSWPYHKSPYDCWRIYPDGFLSLCEEAGLTAELCLHESLEKDVIDSVCVARKP